MSYVMNVVFKAKDEISPYLNNIGNNGRQVVAGLEEDFINANSAMNQTAKSISDVSTHLSSFSGRCSTAVSQTEQFTAAISDESEELRKNAQSLQIILIPKRLVDKDDESKFWQARKSAAGILAYGKVD